MKIYRDLMKYYYDQAYQIPTVVGPRTTFWWPWVKNYSGEVYVGYQNLVWPQYIWIDQELKKSMGY